MRRLGEDALFKLRERCSAIELVGHISMCPRLANHEALRIVLGEELNVVGDFRNVC